MFTVVAFCAVYNGCGVVVSYGGDQNLGTGWCATGSQPTTQVGPKDLAWDYPGA